MYLLRQRLYTCNMQVAAAQRPNNIGLSSTGHHFAHQQLEFRASTSNLAMLCIFRRSAASRPLAGMHQFSSALHHHLRPRYLNRWFSQSPQRLDRPRRYTPEQLAAFTNHYVILGLDRKATDEDIRKAYNHLSKRFHPDMMRNVDSQEYWDNPDRPEFVKVSTLSKVVSQAELHGFLTDNLCVVMKIKDSKEFLLNPTKRRAYDAEYNDILRALQQLAAEKRAAKGLDTKKIIASNLRLDHPTSLQDGSPKRDHCVAQFAGLPPQATAVDLVRAIAKIAPVGRIIDVKLAVPSNTRVERAACIEFANDGCAQHFGLLALHGHIHVLRKQVWHCKLLPARENTLQAPPPEATRVLVIDGPRDHKLMTASALGEFFGHKIKSFDKKVDSCRMMGSETGPNSVTIELAFTTWRGGAKFALAALRREYPELSVSYGRDPCE